MRFNAKNCYTLRINNRSFHFYSLDNHIFQQVSENPYLGVTLSDNLKWGSHIQKVSAKKANSTIAFLRRNLKSCPEQCKIKPPAYIFWITVLLFGIYSLGLEYLQERRSFNCVVFFYKVVKGLVPPNIYIYIYINIVTSNI